MAATEMPSDPLDNHKSIVPRAYQGLGIYARARAGGERPGTGRLTAPVILTEGVAKVRQGRPDALGQTLSQPA